MANLDLLISFVITFSILFITDTLKQHGIHYQNCIFKTVLQFLCAGGGACVCTWLEHQPGN